MAFAPTGFWSYAHADDEATDGQILRLADRLAAEFRLLTGTRLQLFVDRSSLEWGDEWRAKIDTSIHGTTFFIPVITPTFFQRDECRRELLLFQSKSASSDLGELLLPIIFADIQFDEDSDDEVIAIVSAKQGEPFFVTRLEDEQSSAYKKAVHKLAVRLQKISDSVEKKAERATVFEPVTASADEQISLDDEPGFIDSIFETLEIMPRWVESIEQLSVDTDAIGEVFKVTQPALDQAAKVQKSMGPRIAAIRQLSKALDEPTAAFLESARRYRTLTSEIGNGIAAIGSMAAMSGNPEEIQGAIDLADTIEDTQRKLEDSMRQADPLLQISKEIGSLSRDMRQPTKRITEALTVINDTMTFYGGWIERLRDLGEPTPESANFSWPTPPS